MILLIDNFHSRSYSLYQLLASITPDVMVVPPTLFIQELVALKPKAIVLSPSLSASCAFSIVELIQKFSGLIPLLGVGNGHHMICQTLGASMVTLEKPIHGKSIQVLLDSSSKLFQGMDPIQNVAIYSTEFVNRVSLPSELFVTAQTIDGDVMAVHHKQLPIYGVEFHVESFLTQIGEELIRNFLGGIAL